MRTMQAVGSHQRGAVVIVMSLFLVVVIGVLALVVDLGHLYVSKTALQNAADAAALAGAGELDGSAAGVTRAINKAVAVARQNSYDFGVPVGSAAGDGGLILQVGSSPDDMVDAATVDSDLEASDKVYMRVATGDRSVGAWFAGLWGISGTHTFGDATAGQAESEMALVAVCVLPDDPNNPRDQELGYERGVSYKVADMNPISPGTMYWIAGKGRAGECFNSTTDSLPFACVGKAANTLPVGSNVYTNTGISDPQLSALDSRFDVYNPKNRCSPATARPDTNIKEYYWNGAGNGNPSGWMDPDPRQQSMGFTEVAGKHVPIPLSARTFLDYGVLWSGARQRNATVADWPTGSGMGLYGGSATNYPESSPYAQTSGPYFQAPSAGHRGKPGRRNMNVAIVNCEGVSGGSCRPVRVAGYGKFLMQRKSNVAGDKNIYLEFGGLLPTSFPRGAVRLFR